MGVCVQVLLPGSGSGNGSLEGDLMVTITSAMGSAGLLHTLILLS